MEQTEVTRQQLNYWIHKIVMGNVVGDKETMFLPDYCGGETDALSLLKLFLLPESAATPLNPIFRNTISERTPPEVASASFPFSMHLATVTEEQLNRVTRESKRVSGYRCRVISADGQRLAHTFHHELPMAIVLAIRQLFGYDDIVTE